MALMKDVDVDGERIEISDLTDTLLLSLIHDTRADKTANTLSDDFSRTPSDALPSVHRRLVLAREAQTDAKLKALTIEARRRKLKVD